jgi:hypothetical protein
MSATPAVGTTSSFQTRIMPPRREARRPIPHKRPRPVQSCTVCRRQKIKCDRQRPCAQCSKCNRADECEYKERNLLSQSRRRGDSPIAGITEGMRPTTNIINEITIPPTTRTFDADAFADLQNRVLRLESRGQIGHSNDNTISRHPPGNQRVPTGRIYHGLNSSTRAIDLVRVQSLVMVQQGHMHIAEKTIKDFESNHSQLHSFPTQSHL